jgi:hypothetical protein
MEVDVGWNPFIPFCTFGEGMRWVGGDGGLRVIPWYDECMIFSQFFVYAFFASSYLVLGLVVYKPRVSCFFCIPWLPLVGRYEK